MAQGPVAVLFDFDGVLVHSEPLHFLAFKAVADREHLTLTEELYYHELLGYDDRGVVTKLLALNHKPTTPDVVLRLLVEKQRLALGMIHERKFHALPGVEEVVRGLWRHYPLAICSGALGYEIELMLEAVRLRDCFRTIVSADDVKVGKPDPECYRVACERLSKQLHEPIRPADCVVFEDAPRVIDRLAPLGYQCVAIASQVPAARFSAKATVIDALTPSEVKTKLPQLVLYEG